MKPSPSKFLFLLCKGLQRTKTTDNRHGEGGEQPDGWRHKRMRVICSMLNDASENALQMTVPDASLLPFFSLSLSPSANWKIFDHYFFLLACLLACLLGWWFKLPFLLAFLPLKKCANCWTTCLKLPRSGVDLIIDLQNRSNRRSRSSSTAGSRHKLSSPCFQTACSSSCWHWRQRKRMAAAA